MSIFLQLSSMRRGTVVGAVVAALGLIAVIAALAGGGENDIGSRAGGAACGRSPALRSAPAYVHESMLAPSNDPAVVSALAAAAAKCAVRPEIYDPADMSSSFVSIGMSLNSDKVQSPTFKFWKPHNYDGIYSLYLSPFRATPVRMLEIGLGCGMPNGPGRSIPLWRRFLPCAELHMIEFREECAEKFRGELEGLYLGDQSDEKVMNKALEGGPYDIVTDDASHNVNHQVASLVHIFPQVTPGGLYFIEDLATSFEVPWPNTRTAHAFVAGVVAYMHSRDLDKPVLVEYATWEDARYIASLTTHIDCGPAICVFVRNDKPGKE